MLCIQVVYSDILAAFVIFMTLSVTMANTESTFSKKQIIKNITLHVTWLSNNSILNIEQNRIKKLDFDKTNNYKN